MTSLENIDANNTSTEEITSSVIMNPLLVMRETIQTLRLPQAQMDYLLELNAQAMIDQATLEQKASTDYLTKLPSRSAFTETLARDFESQRRGNGNYSLLMVDIDHFKAINDEHGHVEGDKLLANFAEVLQQRLRAEDYPARVGGEEFAVIVGGSNESDAKKLAEDLKQTIAAAPNLRQRTISVGVRAFDTTAGSSPEMLYAQADEALYRAKDTRNTVVAYSEL